MILMEEDMDLDMISVLAKDLVMINHIHHIMIRKRRIVRVFPVISLHVMSIMKNYMYHTVNVVLNVDLKIMEKDIQIKINIIKIVMDVIILNVMNQSVVQIKNYIHQKASVAHNVKTREISILMGLVLDLIEDYIME